MATEDRRIVRTRTRLKGAMLSLLKEKNFKDISITEIAKVAGCNRVTFYSHYEDSTKLLADIFQDYLDELAQYYRDSYKGKKSFTLADATPNIPIFEFVYNNQFIFSLMLMGEVIPGSQNIFCETMGNISRKDLSLQDEVWFDIDAVNAYATYAFLGLFIYWIKQGFESSPKEMAERLAFLHTTSLGEVRVVSNGKY
ncbi:TetR/AcrR family transcriptional regulator [Metasolibacillus meyeri]|uniref:TetR/AcrR family transcriptional regulator n=1 Tax=Metasolibacillus meyeri TaxID=1071052 RepID=A0AAW9NIC6_9BACL|nr:TetR/AcrR family transcriptional regulator [Metasolibacillus meyeri]MEC1178399.1 TetR/AcrR family transcriptional regulator [Metasolibacillus meyeri]